MESPPEALPPKSTGAVLLPWPNRIAGGRYRFDGVDYQLPLTEPAKLNASHGLVRWVRWSAGAHDRSSVTLAHDLAPQTGYPFELRLELSYRLDADAGCGCSTVVTNTGRSAAPFGAGFHPYLDLAGHDLDTAELLVPAAVGARHRRPLDPDRQPAGSRAPRSTSPRSGRSASVRLDHGFAELTGSAAVLRTEQRAVELHWDAAFRYLQVFTPPFITPGRNAVAIEPMSCPANAFNSGDGLSGWSRGHTGPAAGASGCSERQLARRLSGTAARPARPPSPPPRGRRPDRPGR